MIKVISEGQPGLTCYNASNKRLIVKEVLRRNLKLQLRHYESTYPKYTRIKVIVDALEKYQR